jgi:hypothetical protein
MYYRDWSICGASESAIPGWRQAAGPTIVAPCTPLQEWHIDVAWVNQPVGTVNLFAK